MVNSSGNAQQRYTPEQEHEFRQRAFNRPAANDANYSRSQIPQKPASAANDDAFMSPKWADVDKNLNAESARNSTSNLAEKSGASAVPQKRSFGSPDINKLTNEAAARKLPVDASYNGGASRSQTPSTSYNKAFEAGNRIGTSIRNTKNAIASAPENARAAIENKKREFQQTIGNAKNALSNSPAAARAAVQQRMKETSNKIAQTGTAIRQGAENARKEVGAGSARQESRAIKGVYSRRLQTTGTQSNPKGWKEFEAAGKNMAVKGGPVLFWLVAGCAVVKDIIDVFAVLLDLLGIGLAATAVGAPIGIPLTIFSELLNKISGIFIDFTVVAYFGYIGGGFALRIVIMSIGALIDAIPFLDILPLTTVSFFAAYLFGRSVQAVARSGVVGGAVKAIQVSQNIAGGAAKIAGRVSRLVR